MKISPRDIASVLAKPAPKYLCYFFHGADIGLMRERALHMAKQITPDLDDPFQSVSLRGQDIISDPARLSDEVTALAVFSQERLVRVRGTGQELVEAVKLAVPLLQTGSRLIIEASDTTTKHALVKFCEAQSTVASIGCYTDEDKDIGQLARSIFAKDNITIDHAALSLLISRLGGDRLASRSEIDKLALLAGPNGTLRHSDIDEALGDSSAQLIDNMLKSLLTGNVEQLAILMEKIRQEDISPIAILRPLAGHFRQLFEASAHISRGETAITAVGKLRPPVHFKAKPLVTATVQRLAKSVAMAHLQRLIELESDIKSGQISEPYTHMGQGLLGLCLRMRSKTA